MKIERGPGLPTLSPTSQVSYISLRKILMRVVNKAFLARNRVTS